MDLVFVDRAMSPIVAECWGTQPLLLSEGCARRGSCRALFQMLRAVERRRTHSLGLLDLMIELKTKILRSLRRLERAHALGHVRTISGAHLPSEIVNIICDFASREVPFLDGLFITPRPFTFDGPVERVIVPGQLPFVVQEIVSAELRVTFELYIRLILRVIVYRFLLRRLCRIR